MDLNGFYVDQLNNIAVLEAHYQYTGSEIRNQTNGKILTFISCIGTGGALKEFQRI
jgi:cysteine synthase